MRILVKFPSRGRPKQCVDVLTSMMHKAHSVCDYLLSLDADDQPHPDFGAFDVDALTTVIGTSDCKVHAINRDINEHEDSWDILVVASDDMWPMEKGWDTTIREAMQRYYPDTDGMLWFHDGYQRKICTMPIMGRKYYSRFQYVYHPSYRSFFCDDEQTAVAMAHGKIQFIDQLLFQHRHPDNRAPGVKSDDTYRRSIPDWKADERNYHERRSKGFPVCIARTTKNC